MSKAINVRTTVCVRTIRPKLYNSQYYNRIKLVGRQQVILCQVIAFCLTICLNPFINAFLISTALKLDTIYIMISVTIVLVIVAVECMVR